MLFFYYEKSGNSGLKKYNIEFRIKTEKNAIITLSNVLVKNFKSSLEPISFLDKIKGYDIVLYDETHFMKILNDFYEQLDINILQREFKGHNLLMYVCNNITSKDIKTNYIGIRSAYKLFEIGSFLFLKRNVRDIVKNNYILLVFKISRYTINKNVDFNVKNIIIKSEKIDLYSISFLLHMSSSLKAFLHGVSNSIQTYDYRVLNIKISLLNTITDSYTILSNGFVKIMEVDDTALYLKALNEKDIYLFEYFIHTPLNAKQHCLETVYYKEFSKNEFFDMLLKKQFNLDSIVDFLKLLNHKIYTDNKPNHRFIQMYFDILLAISLTYSNKINKIDSFKINMNDFYLGRTFILIYVKEDGATDEEETQVLDNFVKTLLPNKNKVKGIIKEATINIDLYKSDLSFLGKDSYFVFPVLRITQREDNINKSLTKKQRFEKNYKFQLLNREFSNTIYIESDFITDNMIKNIKRLALHMYSVYKFI